jgi:hypothetical protein
VGRLVAAIISFTAGVGCVAALVLGYSEYASVARLAGLVFGAALFGVIIPVALYSGRR